MSVWDNPCYAIEPLRNAVNNYPIGSLKVFPSELSGIANFRIGECHIYHPEKAGRVASEYFKQDVKAWQEFVESRSGRSKLGKHDQVAFQNTVKQCNIKYAGIRAVYWAYEKFSQETWRTKETYDKEDARAFTQAIWTLNAAPSRVNQEDWDKAFEEIWPKAKQSHDWLEADEKADAVNQIWTINRSHKFRSLRKKRAVVIGKVFGAKIIEPTTGVGVQSRMHEVPTSGIAGRRYDSDAAVAAYKRTIESVKAGEEISKHDYDLVVTMPFVSYPENKSRLIIFRFEGGYILYDKRESKGGIFHTKDHERLCQMMKSRAQLVRYYGNYSIDDRALTTCMLNKFYELEAEFFKAYKLDDPVWANKVCRAYDVVQFIYLASLASDMTDRSLKDQLDKVEKEQLGEIIDIHKCVALVDDERFGVKESLELLKFYKIFPCPDFCVYTVVDSIADKGEKRHTTNWGAVLGSVGGVQVTADNSEFLDYCMRNRLISYFDAHGTLPGRLRTDEELEEGDLIPMDIMAYPMMQVSRIKPHHMKYIDFKGTFVYRRYDMCEDELVKDKTTAVTSKAETKIVNEERVPRMYARNQVLQYLFSPSFMGQREINEGFADMTFFDKTYNTIDLALKPEAKKPGSRAFSMASDPIRRQLSEFEINVATYVRNQRGSSQGKDDINLDQKLASLCDTIPYGKNEFFVSFDLEAFSPKQAAQFKVDAFKTWEYVFDEPDICNVKEIFNKCSLVFNKFGVNDKYDLTMNDLEGFNGRMNTAAHIDLMGYAVYKLRQLGIVNESAGLEVLIDDGLLRLCVSGNWDSEPWQDAIDVIEAVYSAAGLRISWDKTFVSQVMCQYLNRVFYDGCEVTPGVKAFMRIGKIVESPVPTIVDELESHAASTRGAIKSGSDHRLAFFAYAFEVYRTMLKWSGRDSRVKLGKTPNLAFMCYVPVDLGGFGISTLFGLSTNESFGSKQSGIAAMRMMCFAYPKLKPLANKVLNSPLRDMDGGAILRNPTGFRTVYRCLNTSRFANSAKSYVKKFTVNALVKSATQVITSDVYEPAVALMDGENLINDIQRTKLWEMSQSKFLEKVLSKLQTSRTAASMLGGRRCAALFMINRSEAKALIHEIITEKLVRRDF